jgi:hypothetical protein
MTHTHGPLVTLDVTRTNYSGQRGKGETEPSSLSEIWLTRTDPVHDRHSEGLRERLTEISG